MDALADLSSNILSAPSVDARHGNLGGALWESRIGVVLNAHSAECTQTLGADGIDAQSGFELSQPVNGCQTVEVH